MTWLPKACKAVAATAEMLAWAGPRYRDILETNLTAEELFRGRRRYSW
jgi:hypothetical protein